MSATNAIERLRLLAWRAGFDLEEARQAHAAMGRRWREAGCCVGLAMLALLRTALVPGGTK